MHVVRLRVFESGVLVVQSLSHSEEAVTEESHKLVGQPVAIWSGTSMNTAEAKLGVFEVMQLCFRST